MTTRRSLLLRLASLAAVPVVGLPKVAQSLGQTGACGIPGPPDVGMIVMHYLSGKTERCGHIQYHSTDGYFAIEEARMLYGGDYDLHAYEYATQEEAYKSMDFPLRWR